MASLYAPDSEDMTGSFISPRGRRPLLMAVGLVAALLVQVLVGLDSRVLAAIWFLVALGCWVTLMQSAATGLISRRFVFATAAVALAICVAVPPATSKDVNSYAMYGRMVAKYDASPYVHVPRDFPGDAWYPRVSYFWNDSPSVYGPVFTAASAGVMSVAGPSYDKARLGFQLLAALAFIGCVVLVSRRFRENPAATVFVALNPLLLTFGVNDAHADLLLGFAVLSAVLLLDRRMALAAGAILGLAALVKISALPAVGGALVWAFFKLGRTAALKFGVASAATLAAGLLLAGGREALAPLLTAAGRHSRFSIWNPIHDLVSAIAPEGIDVDSVISLGASVAVVGVGLWLILKYRHAGSSVFAVTAGLVAYQVLGAYTLSWYAAWSLPALALVWRSRLAQIAMAHGSWIAVAYLNGYFALALVVLAVPLIWWHIRTRPSQSAAST